MSFLVSSFLTVCRVKQSVAVLVDGIKCESVGESAALLLPRDKGYRNHCSRHPLSLMSCISAAPPPPSVFPSLPLVHTGNVTLMLLLIYYFHLHKHDLANCKVGGSVFIFILLEGKRVVWWRNTRICFCILRPLLCHGGSFYAQAFCFFCTHK